MARRVALATDGVLMFWCPGCDGAHGVETQYSKDLGWEWNDSYEAPTITPSIVIGHQDRDGNRVVECHSWVRDGRIEFLSDSAHKLAGQTVDLPEWVS